MNLYFTLIVRNEAHVIRRCLDSLLPAAPDGLIIHDTGSTDDTPEVLWDWALGHEIDLRLLRVKWADFAKNRSSLLAYAKKATEIGDYFWMIDADDVLVFDTPDPASSLRAQLASGHDVYDVPIEYGGLRYTRPQIVRNNRSWRYRGVLHEFLEIPPGATRAALSGVVDTPIQDGARSQDPEKFNRDVDTLETALADENDKALHPRYTFYLAQCLRDAGRLSEALETYLDRLDNPFGYEQERYVAAYNAVRLARRVYPGGSPDATAEQYRVICCLLDGLELCPERWELQHDLIAWFWQHKRYRFARRLIPEGALVEVPPTGLFVEPHIYQWSMADQAAITFYFAGEYARSFAVTHSLLVHNHHLPASERLRVIENLRWAAERLGQKEQSIHARLLEEELLK